MTKTTKTKFIFLAIFLSFFFANSYSSQVRALMWPLKFAVLGLSSTYIIYSIRKKSRYLERYPPNYIYICLTLALTFNIYSLQAYNPMISFDVVYGHKLLIVFLFVCLFSIQLARFFSVSANQKALYFAMIGGGAVITYSNLLLYLLGMNLGRGAGSIGGTGGIGRFSGWLDNPNTLGVILLGTFPIAFQMALKRGKILTYESTLVSAMLLLVFLTGSRSTLLAVTVMGAMLLWTHSHKTKFIAILLVLLGGVIALSNPDTVDSSAIAKYTPQFDRQGADVLSGRTSAWELGVKLVQEKPFFGYGFGAEGALLEKFMPANAAHQGKYFHNSYLSLLISSGFIGGAPLLVLLITAVTKAIRVLARRGRGEDQFTFLMCIMFLGFLVHGFFETWIFSPGSVYCFFFWFACFWILSRPRRSYTVSAKNYRRMRYPHPRRPSYAKVPTNPETTKYSP